MVGNVQNSFIAHRIDKNRTVIEIVEILNGTRIFIETVEGDDVAAAAKRRAPICQQILREV